jgi:PBSX family phage terminase large subunit
LLASGCIDTMLYGGSRSGKTFILFRALIIRCIKSPGSRHVIFRQAFAHIKASIYYNTYPDVFKKCFPELKKSVHYDDNRSDWFIQFYNGSQIWLAGLDEGERTDKILGQEYSTIWFNECSQIKYISITTAKTRLSQSSGLNLQCYYDMNPPTKKHWSYKLFIQKIDPDSNTEKQIPDPENYVHIKMNPIDNAENLPPIYLKILENLTGKQRERFLSGEFTSDIEGALWTYEMIDDAYCDTPIQDIEFLRLAIAIDPAVTAKKTSDETGIIWGGYATDGNYYVCDDLSGIYTVSQWAEIAVNVYHDEMLTAIVAETNQGGDMVEHAIQQEAAKQRRSVNYINVRATRGKYKRAEPAAQLYEQGKVRHLRHFKLLEDQMLTYTPTNTDESPDRLDSLVWLLFYLSNERAPDPFVL